MSTAGSFMVPMTFVSQAAVDVSSQGRNLVQESCTTAQPTRVVSWKSNEEGGGLAGAVVGCADGSLFVFCPDFVQHSAPESNVSKSPSPSIMSRPRSPHLRSPDSHTHTRSNSPSGFYHPTFNVTSPSRIVSGVNTEQVEAPKNYVDFDDEPGKLKSILHGRGQKERAAKAEENSAKGDEVGRRHSTDLSRSKKKQKQPPQSLLSATNSPAFTPKPISMPVSPNNANIQADGLTLLCHILPPTAGEGHSVSDIQYISETRNVLVLQESGYVIPS